MKDLFKVIDDLFDCVIDKSVARVFFHVSRTFMSVAIIAFLGICAVYCLMLGA